MGNVNEPSRSLDDRRFTTSNTRTIGSHRPRASDQPSSNISSRELMVADYSIQISDLQNLFSHKGCNEIFASQIQQLLIFP